MTVTEQKIFFNLLQASLWQRNASPELFTADDWWSHILKALDSHSLLALASDAIMTVNEKLPKEKKLTPHQQMDILQNSANTAQAHFDLNQSVLSIFSALTARHSTSAINPILLKGQGLATLYPICNTRSCGDIDIYVGKENYETAKSIINSFCTEEEIKAVEEDFHQYHITHNGITCELHPIAGISAISFYQKAYEQWQAQQLIPTKCDSANIELNDGLEHKVLVPSVQFNVPYLFDHLCRHLRFQGVGVRQFVDLALVLHLAATKGPTVFDHNIFKSDLDRLGLFRAWQILSGILVYNLGLPKSECPFFNDRKAMKSQTSLLRNILADAHFGLETKWRNEEQKHDYNFHRVLLCYRQQWRYLRLDFQLFPCFAIYEFLRQTTRTLFIALGLKEANY